MILLFRAVGSSSAERALTSSIASAEEKILLMLGGSTKTLSSMLSTTKISEWRDKTI